MRLLTNSQTPDDVQICLRTVLAQIVQQTTTSADQRQEATPCRVVLLMCSHVFGQAVNPSCQNGNLNFRRTRIIVAVLKLLDYFLLLNHELALSQLEFFYQHLNKEDLEHQY